MVDAGSRARLRGQRCSLMYVFVARATNSLSRFCSIHHLNMPVPHQQPANAYYVQAPGQHVVGTPQHGPPHVQPHFAVRAPPSLPRHTIPETVHASRGETVDHRGARPTARTSRAAMRDARYVDWHSVNGRAPRAAATLLAFVPT